MGFFEQIIFQPIRKKFIPISSISTSKNKFDYWITEENSESLLWVKCPICFFTYSLYTIGNVEICKEVMEKYIDFNYRRVIKECPHFSSHLEFEKERRLLTAPRQSYD